MIDNNDRWLSSIILISRKGKREKEKGYTL